jgi:hypothetical protein
MLFVRAIIPFAFDQVYPDHAGLRLAGGAMDPSIHEAANHPASNPAASSTIAEPKRRMVVLHAIRAFVDHPLTRLAVAIILIISGFIEAYDTFKEDVSHLRVRIGHGIILLGFMNAFSSLPPVVDGIERWLKLEDAKAERSRAAADPATPEKLPNVESHS